MNRQLEQLLIKAEQAIQNRDFPEAIRILGPMLASDVARIERMGIEIDATELESDAFLDPKRRKGARKSFKREVLQLLCSIPAREMQFYELDYGKTAAAALQNRIERRKN